MSVTRIVLLGIVGFVFYLAAVRISTRSVNAEEIGTVHLYITHEIVSDSKDSPDSFNVPGRTIVGFSCISKPASVTLEKHAVCFIASSSDSRQ